MYIYILKLCSVIATDKNHAINESYVITFYSEMSFLNDFLLPRTYPFQGGTAEESFQVSVGSG